jgi:competence protein CoiA
MLTAIRTSDGATSIAWEEQRENAPFACPECSASVVLKKGRVVAHHFAHKPPVICEYGSGESHAHHECKRAIFDALNKAPNVTKCAVERGLGSVRPDVSAFIGGIPVAIEIQRSNISTRLLEKRMREYSKKGVHLVWVCLGLDRCDDDGEKIAPNLWQKWLHAAYFGRVYYWDSSVGGACLWPVHYSEHLLWVEPSEWFAGGYHRTSKRFRTADFGPPVDLSRNFVARKRDGWSGGQIAIPDSLLYIDDSPAWWERKEWNERATRRIQARQ